jgi:filamentous hemagglutinin
VQVDPPAALTGSVGDVAGMIAYDSDFLYYCFQDFNGTSVIWNKVPNTGNAQVTALTASGNITGAYFFGNGSALTGVVAGAPNAIVNGTTSISTTPGGNANITIAGTSNVAVFSTTGLAITGTSTATGNITGSNLNTAGQVVATGNITGGNVVSTALVSGATVTATGNITGGNVTTVGRVTATGNVTGGNLVTGGNVSGNFIIGDGGFLSNVTAVSNVVVTSIANGTSSIAITGSGANGTVTIDGASNVVIFTSTGANITGYVTATAAVTASNFFTTGPIDASANITGGNLLTSGRVISTGNVVGGNLTTTGLISAGTTVTATGNVVGGNLTTAGLVSAGTTVTATGNVVGGNLTTAGRATATGNVTGGNLVTAGITSTGSLTASTTVTATGNVTGGNIKTSAVTISSTAISGATTITATGNVTGGNLVTAGLITATGNITGGNISSPGLINVVGSITGNGSLTINAGNSATAINNGGGNAVGNIGTSAKYFNTVFAQATSALYADLAECYLADADYEAGTVLSFGGSAEVTVSSQDHDVTVAGVVSTSPAYQMNSGLEGDYVVVVALTGRVPCQVQGPVTAGAMMVSAGNGRARAEKNPAMGTVIGKALQSFNGDFGTIEVVVGRL